MKSNPTISTAVIVGGLIAIGALALAGVLLIQPGNESTTRLGFYFGVVGAAAAALVAALKAGQAATQTNGSLDDRIEAGVHRALAGRRAVDQGTTVTRIQSPAPDPVEIRNDVEPIP